MTTKEFIFICAVFFLAFFSTLSWINKPARLIIEVKQHRQTVKPVGQLPSGMPTQLKDL